MKLYSKSFPVPLFTVERTNSTNSYLRGLFRKGEPAAFSTVVANYQTAGRGQRGNYWESEDGRNLLFSFVIFPDFLEARSQFLISQIVALSIKEVLSIYVQGISIKWPNDIYWQERKICGMLIENELQGNVISQSIIGVGININQQEFTSKAPNPVSLWQITHKEYDCLDILAQVMVRVQEYYSLLLRNCADIISENYQNALFRNNGMYPYTDKYGKFQAKIIRIEPDGSIVLSDCAERERKYTFKEVHYCL